ncbi:MULTISPECIES: hypothetical protein [unclassified Streptomyces]|uniref:hypothetical protein n=1 Tax=unclassified Streptomyces TaxID=2593676 RepID=UPI002E2BC62C|nr:hypothetical protein [Streptomyces sp. NBC_00223]
MRTTRLLAASALLAGVFLAALSGTAAADDPSTDPGTSADPGASATPGDGDAAPTEAGTDFRTATVVRQGQEATAAASTGDYLYWVFPADAGQNVTVTATVTFPSTETRHGPSTWQIDVYDGLRRHQSCRYGSTTRTGAADTASIELACHLRTVRAWAEPWSNDPLRGAYYLRLTVLDLPQTDLGLPVQAAVKATSQGTGGRQAVDGSVAPVVSANAPDVSPEGGWAGTWWSPRWLWTGGGGLLAALLAVGAHRLARGPVRQGGYARPPESVRERPRAPGEYGY